MGSHCFPFAAVKVKFQRFARRLLLSLPFLTLPSPILQLQPLSFAWIFYFPSLLHRVPVVPSQAPPLLWPIPRGSSHLWLPPAIANVFLQSTWEVWRAQPVTNSLPLGVRICKNSIRLPRRVWTPWSWADTEVSARAAQGQNLSPPSPTKLPPLAPSASPKGKGRQ